MYGCILSQPYWDILIYDFFSIVGSSTYSSVVLSRTHTWKKKQAQNSTLQHSCLHIHQGYCKLTSNWVNYRKVFSSTLKKSDCLWSCSTFIDFDCARLLCFLLSCDLWLDSETNLQQRHRRGQGNRQWQSAENKVLLFFCVFTGTLLMGTKSCTPSMIRGKNVFFLRKRIKDKRLQWVVWVDQKCSRRFIFLLNSRRNFHFHTTPGLL